MLEKTTAFNNAECQCECGNKHEIYGGIGYINHGIATKQNDWGETVEYRHDVTCKQCNRKHYIIDKEN